jgi:hypothetical protein
MSLREIMAASSDLRYRPAGHSVTAAGDPGQSGDHELPRLVELDVRDHRKIVPCPMEPPRRPGANTIE